MQLNQERSFLQAEVFYLDDENEPAATSDLETALRLHGEIMELAGAQPEDTQKTDSSQLAYRLAGSLPFDPDFQQTLLEMNSEADRIRSIVTFFERILPTLQQSARAKRKAGGNGHVTECGGTITGCGSRRIIGVGCWFCGALSMSFPRTLGELRRSPFSEETCAPAA